MLAISGLPVLEMHLVDQKINCTVVHLPLSLIGHKHFKRSDADPSITKVRSGEFFTKSLSLRQNRFVRKPEKWPYQSQRATSPRTGNEPPPCYAQTAQS